MSDPVHIISLGAGVQSSTMALMAANGEITPLPTAAVFADTQDEPALVYRWLDWLETQLPFPVYRVTAGQLSLSIAAIRRSKKGRDYFKTSFPAFTITAHGKRGKIGKRSCTRDFKLRPLWKKQREIGSIKRGQKTVGVVSWIGISRDEASRMKPSRKPWVQHRWPMIEQNMTRIDCLAWMESHGYPRPPRSACVYCPFHSNSEWRRLRDEEPDAFARAVEFEKTIHAHPRGGSMNSKIFLHRSCVPISEAPIDGDKSQINLFENECEGMCGV